MSREEGPRHPEGEVSLRSLSWSCVTDRLQPSMSQVSSRRACRADLLSIRDTFQFQSPLFRQEQLLPKDKVRKKLLCDHIPPQPQVNLAPGLQPCPTLLGSPGPSLLHLSISLLWDHQSLHPSLSHQPHPWHIYHRFSTAQS